MSRAPRALLLLFTAAALRAQTAPDPAGVLAQARERLRTLTRDLSNYACIETVDRSYFAAGGHELESTDRLRLDVSVAQGREIHSWPGASRFDSRRVDDLIGEGPVAAGAFGTYLIDVFDNSGAEFRYAGAESGGTRTVLTYDFRVPLPASHYQVKAGTSWRAAAYAGSFRIDPASLDLARLTVQLDELPAENPIAEATATLDYQRVRVGDGDILLPRVARLDTLLRSGKTVSNITTFSDCREYQAESELHFDDDAGGENSGAKPAVRSALAVPLGLPLWLALDAPLDSDKAAAGDPVSVKVVKPVQRPGSNEILIPPGATVRGRVTRSEHHLRPEPYFLIAVAFDRLELNGASSPFYAMLDQGDDLARALGANPPARGRGVQRWARGVFLFPTNRSRHVFPAGYRSKWMTLATPAR